MFLQLSEVGSWEVLAFTRSRTDVRGWISRWVKGSVSSAGSQGEPCTGRLVSAVRTHPACPHPPVLSRLWSPFLPQRCMSTNDLSCRYSREVGSELRFTEKNQSCKICAVPNTAREAWGKVLNETSYREKSSVTRISFVTVTAMQAQQVPFQIQYLSHLVLFYNKWKQSLACSKLLARLRNSFAYIIFSTLKCQKNKKWNWVNA